MCSPAGGVLPGHLREPATSPLGSCLVLFPSAARDALRLRGVALLLWLSLLLTVGGASHPGQQPHIQQPGGRCRLHCLLVGGVDQVDSLFPQLWGRGDIPGAPLPATEVSSPETPQGGGGVVGGSLARGLVTFPLHSHLMYTGFSSRWRPLGRELLTNP